MNRDMRLLAQLYIIILMSLHVLRLMVAISPLPVIRVLRNLNSFTLLAEGVPIGTFPSITAKIGIKILILHLNLVCHFRLF